MWLKATGILSALVLLLIGTPSCKSKQPQTKYGPPPVDYNDTQTKYGVPSDYEEPIQTKYGVPVPAPDEKIN